MKRKTKLLNSVAILFVVGTVSIVSVNAANNGDTGYTYNFSALDQYKTDFRLKEDIRGRCLVKQSFTRQIK